ncbi:MAG: hypothetical protein LBR37_03320 [Erysipelotrichaceae bacterium]|jgi:hypothetical protein|nr:hypothetical protein [Erysipelotrichaceae bacterium]
MKFLKVKQCLSFLVVLGSLLGCSEPSYPYLDGNSLVVSGESFCTDIIRDSYIDLVFVNKEELFKNNVGTRLYYGISDHHYDDFHQKNYRLNIELYFSSHQVPFYPNIVATTELVWEYWVNDFRDHNDQFYDVIDKRRCYYIYKLHNYFGLMVGVPDRSKFNYLLIYGYLYLGDELYEPLNYGDESCFYKDEMWLQEVM